MTLWWLSNDNIAKTIQWVVLPKLKKPKNMLKLTGGTILTNSINWQDKTCINKQKDLTISSHQQITQIGMFSSIWVTGCDIFKLLGLTIKFFFLVSVNNELCSHISQRKVLNWIHATFPPTYHIYITFVSWFNEKTDQSYSCVQ